MDKKDPHWFVEFARKTNLYIGVTSLLFVLWFLMFGLNNMKYVWLAEIFGGDDALEFQKKHEMAKVMPELFTAKFYKLDETAQLQNAEMFWEKRLAAIAKYLPPEEQASAKEKLFAAIHRMYNPISDKNTTEYDEWLELYRKARVGNLPSKGNSEK